MQEGLPLIELDSSGLSEEQMTDIESAIGFLETLEDVPMALEDREWRLDPLAYHVEHRAPLAYSITRIPRIQKPRLMDAIVAAFNNGVFKLDVNPPFSLLAGFDVMQLLNFVDTTVSYTGAINAMMQSVMYHNEVTLFAVDVTDHPSFEDRPPLSVLFWRFADIFRLDAQFSHFTKFIILCLVKDQPLEDYTNMIAFSLDNPHMKNAIWNAEDKKSICKVIAAEKNSILGELASAHIALDRIMQESGASRPPVHSIMLRNKLLMTPEYHTTKHDITDEPTAFKPFGEGIKNDFLRRMPYYWQDWKDGLAFKPLAVSLALALSLLPYILIIGSVFAQHTGRNQYEFTALAASIIAGIMSSIIGAQPMIFLMPSGAYAIFVGTVYDASLKYDADFRTLFPLMNIIAAILLIVYACFNVSRLIKFLGEFGKEIFMAFVSIVLLIDAFKICLEPETQELKFFSFSTAAAVCITCAIISSIRYSTLTFSWLRSAANDSAAIIAFGVVYLTLRFAWGDIYAQMPQYTKETLQGSITIFHPERITKQMIGLAVGFGFLASILILFEHSIFSKSVNGKAMNLTKPAAYHLDLLLLGIINLVLGFLCLPSVVASKLHTFHHIHAMSTNSFEFDNDGVMKSYNVNVRETRITGLLSYSFVALILFFPSAMEIPVAIMAGILIFIGAVPLTESTITRQLISLFWNPLTLPPNHYLRNVKRYKVFLLNLVQIGSIVSIYLVEHSVVGFLYPLFIVVIIATFRIISAKYATDVLIIEHGADAI